MSVSLGYSDDFLNMSAYATKPHLNIIPEASLESSSITGKRILGYPEARV
jgi:hypothetical protein